MKSCLFFILFSVYSVLLCGCATNAQPKTVNVPAAVRCRCPVSKIRHCPRVTNTQSKAVNVPVAVHCPVPKIPPKPSLPIANIREDNPNEVMKAYVATVKILIGYNRELLHLLKSYKG